MDAFNGLIKAEFTPPKTWMLTRELSFKTSLLTSEEIQLLQDIGVECNTVGEIKVKSGFKTDLASVPRSLWALISPWDIARAAVIHDNLYHSCSSYYKEGNANPEIWKQARKISDKIFLLAMNASEPPVPEWKKKSAYLAVRIFGSNPAKGV